MPKIDSPKECENLVKNLVKISANLLNSADSRNFPIVFKHEDENFLIIPESDFRAIAEHVSELGAQIARHVLEKEVAREMPKDLEDVVAVVSANLASKNPSPREIRRVLGEIKAQYPNLFIDINEYFKEMHDEDE